MTSVQGKILKTYLRIQKFLKKRSTEYNYQSERQSLEELSKLFKPLAPVKTESIMVECIPAELIIPPGAHPGALFLYLHGGGYCAGSIQSHFAHTANLALAAGMQALLIAYRLAPEHPFPAALDDSVTAYLWLLEQGYKPQRTVIGGDSAGGGLALALLLQLRDKGISLPSAAVCLSPWTDLVLQGRSYRTNAKSDIILNLSGLAKDAEMYLAGADAHTPLASPLYANLYGLPPLLIQVGSDEMLLSDATSLAEHARQAGVDVTLEVWEEMQHVWHFSAKMVPEARKAVERVGAYIRGAVSQA